MKSKGVSILAYNTGFVFKKIGPVAFTLAFVLTTTKTYIYLWIENVHNFLGSTDLTMDIYVENATLIGYAH